MRLHACDFTTIITDSSESCCHLTEATFGLSTVPANIIKFIKLPKNRIKIIIAYKKKHKKEAINLLVASLIKFREYEVIGLKDNFWGV